MATKTIKSDINKALKKEYKNVSKIMDRALDKKKKKSKKETPNFRGVDELNRQHSERWL